MIIWKMNIKSRKDFWNFIKTNYLVFINVREGVFYIQKNYLIYLKKLHLKFSFGESGNSSYAFSNSSLMRIEINSSKCTLAFHSSNFSALTGAALPARKSEGLNNLWSMTT